MVLRRGGQQGRGYLQKKKKMEEFPRCNLLEVTIYDFIDEQVKKNTRAKNDRDVSLLKNFMQRQVELRNFDEIPPAQLNELLSERVVLTVRTKDGNNN